LFLCYNGLMDKKIIIFDFDGTIADSMPLIVSIFKNMAKKEGAPEFSDAQIEEMRNLSAIQLIKKLKISKFRLPFIMRSSRKKFRERLSEVKIIPGIFPVLQELKRKGCSLGILSSNSLKTINSFLNNNKLDCFDFIYSDRSLFGKAGILKKLIKKYKFDVNSVFYIGDEIRDIEAAKKAGIRIIAVSWGMNSRKSLLENKPDYLAENPEDLFRFLLKNN